MCAFEIVSLIQIKSAGLIEVWLCRDTPVTRNLQRAGTVPENSKGYRRYDKDHICLEWDSYDRSGPMWSDCSEDTYKTPWLYTEWAWDLIDVSPLLKLGNGISICITTPGKARGHIWARFDVIYGKQHWFSARCDHLNMPNGELDLRAAVENKIIQDLISVSHTKRKRAA